MKPLLTHLLALAIGISAAFLWRSQTDREDTASTHDARPGKSVEARGSRPAERTGDRPEVGKHDIKAQLEKPVERADFDAWLETRKVTARSHAEALVTVGMLTNNPVLVRHGIESDPRNAHLLFIGATLPAFSDEDRLAMSQRLQAAAPDNAFGAYLSAAYLTEAGQPDAAIQIMKGASTQTRMDDFRMATQLMTEEALIAAGLSPDAAKIKSALESNCGYLSDLKALTQSLKDKEGTLPPQEASELRYLTASMGQRLGDQSKFGTLIDRLSGMSMEELALKGLPDDAPSPYAGFTVREARESIAAERAELRQIMGNMPDLDMNNTELMSRYIDRVRMLGELEALKWLKNIQAAGVDQ